MIQIIEIIFSMIVPVFAIEASMGNLFTTDGHISLYATLAVVIGIVLVGIVLAIIIYPRYARKKALKLKVGQESAMPRRQNAKTNPRYTREDGYVDSSEPNPFLKK
jgi:hypothetical protein